MGEAKRRGSYQERVKQAFARKSKLPDNICIICRQENNEMSDEHVIPDALGGYYHIYCVCKNCNSFLGSNVDKHLTQHKLTEFYRLDKEIYGKSRKLPNPFTGYLYNEQKPELKYQISIDKNKKFNFCQLPSPPKVEKDENGKIRQVTIIADEKDKQKIKKDMKKIIERNEIDENEIYTTETIETLDQTTSLKGEFKINTKNFKLGLLKIAYEFAVDKIPNYYYDPMAIKISKILHTANLIELDNIKMSSGLDMEIFKPFEKFIDFNNKHVLILIDINSGLKCFIKLDDTFSIIIELSDKSYLDNNINKSIVLLNSRSNKNVKSMTLFEMIHEHERVHNTSFQFYSENEQEIDIIKNQKINYYGKNSNPILFDIDGNILYQNFHDFLIKHSTSNNEFTDNIMIAIYKFNTNQSVYIRSIDDGKLYQVVGFKMEVEFDKI